MTNILEGASLLRRQVVDRLNGDATLMERVKQVYAKVPPVPSDGDTPQPYLIAYPLRVVDQSALGEGEDGAEISLSITAVWGHDESDDDAHPLIEVFARVHELLHGYAVELDGFDATQLLFTEMDEEEDADGRGFDGHITFQCTLLRDAEED